jgi:uncharacterized protein YaaN involved in tellurite resistance
MASSNGFTAAALGSQMETATRVAPAAHVESLKKRWYEIFRSTDEEKRVRQQMREERRAAIRKSKPEG